MSLRIEAKILATGHKALHNLCPDFLPGCCPFHPVPQPVTFSNAPSFSWAFSYTVYSAWATLLLFPLELNFCFPRKPFLTLQMKFGLPQLDFSHKENHFFFKHVQSCAALRTGICSKKCIIRLFWSCVNSTEYTHTNLDGPAYYTPGL